MSNLDLWYYAGVFVLSASIAYIAFSASRFMGAEKKDSKSSATDTSNEPPADAQFLRHAVLAFLGIMVGAQLLQYHQDQQGASKKDIGRDMTMAQALGVQGASTSNAVGIAGSKSGNPSELGARPTSRPPRGYFSVAEAEKAAAGGRK